MHTDPVADEIDRAQYESDAGPCLDAFRRNTVVSVPSMAEGDSWTGFREAAMARGVYSSLALPMTAGERRVGALDLYAREHHAFRAVPPPRCSSPSRLRPQSGAATNQGMRDLIGHLETALETRELIGMAKGVIMANDRLPPDEAFAVLVAASRHRNVELRDVALEVATTGATPTVRN